MAARSLGSLLELVHRPAHLCGAVDLCHGGFVPVKVGLVGLGLALGQLLAPRGCSKLGEDVVLLQSLLQHGLLCEAGDVHLEVGDGEALEVHHVAHHIGAVYEGLQRNAGRCRQTLQHPACYYSGDNAVKRGIIPKFVL